jgi:hypothetical protein
MKQRLIELGGEAVKCREQKRRYPVPRISHDGAGGEGMSDLLIPEQGISDFPPTGPLLAL